MLHNFINWTKYYDLIHQNGNFNVVVSHHQQGHYLAVVIYYVEGGIPFSDGMIPKFTLKYKQFGSLLESELNDQCTKWIDENLPGKYTITLVERNDFI